MVILGHSNCGAVQVALDDRSDDNSNNDIIEKIKLSVNKLHQDDFENESDYYNAIIDENIKRSIAIVEKFITNTTIVGAKYFLDSGIVKFFE